MSGGARQQRKKALTILMEAVSAGNFEAHESIVTTWLQVLRDPDHPKWEPALREYNKYILGMPVQQVEHELKAPMSTWVDPTLLAAMGVDVMQVQYQDEDGETRTKHIVSAAKTQRSEGDAG